jgi:hypothetical protein
MRVIRFAGAALVAAVAVAVTAAGADSAKKVKVTCMLHLQTLAPSGIGRVDFGTVACASVFGKGVQHDRLTVVLTSQTTGIAIGPFKQFFDTGTIHGRMKLIASVASGGVVTYMGTGKVSGGTGAYKHVRGSAKMVCRSPDGGTHTTCTSTARLTGI